MTAETEFWQGYRCEKFHFEEHDAIIVFPKDEMINGYLAVKTEYWNAFPLAIEVPLVANGFHLCYIKNDNRWGTNQDLERKARFIRFVQEKYGLKSRCVPVGMSCGGLFAIKLAAKYPELIKCLYLDAPVVNYLSCPCGFGKGQPLFQNFSEIMEALELSTIGELMAYRDMPLDYLPALVEGRIPLVMVVGDSDHVVPYHENGIFIQRAYEQAGIELEIYTKPGCAHHPHGLEDPKPVLEFILRCCD